MHSRVSHDHLKAQCEFGKDMRMFYFYILPQVLWGENSDLSDFHKACKGSQKITEVHSVSSHHAPEIRSERFNML